METNPEIETDTIIQLGCLILEMYSMRDDSYINCRKFIVMNKRSVMVFFF